MYKLTLSSGNVFYYKPEDSANVAVAITTNPSKMFLGGFAGLEASRKFAAFRQFASIEDCKFPNIEDFNLLEFAEKLGTASNFFIKRTDLVFNDVDWCNGTSSKAQSCDDRLYYYEKIGLKSMFKTRMNCPLWAFIANHLSIFGVELFKETFFKGYENDPIKDVSLDSKSRYSNHSFKAPAAYIRALCQ